MGVAPGLKVTLLAVAAVRTRALSRAARPKSAVPAGSRGGGGDEDGAEADLAAYSPLGRVPDS